MFCSVPAKATFGSSKMSRSRWRGNASLSAGGGELPDMNETVKFPLY